jgi:hypothetical protein
MDVLCQLQVVKTYPVDKCSVDVCWIIEYKSDLINQWEMLASADEVAQTGGWEKMQC